MSKPSPIERLRLGDLVKLSAETPAGNADVMLQGKVGEVIELAQYASEQPRSGRVVRKLK